MEAISLKKVTAIVGICIIGSYLVSANATANDLKVENKLTKANITISESALSQFSPLIEKFDLDKNGLLSKQEVKAAELENLLNNFDEIDLNTDSGISEEEFNQFIALVK